MIPAIECGDARPVIDLTLPLDRPGKIAVHLRSGRAVGMVIVAIHA